MAKKLVVKKLNVVNPNTYHKNSWKRKFICTTTFIFIIAILVIYNSTTIQNKILMSILEMPVVTNPDTIKIVKLSTENERLRELVNRGNIDREKLNGERQKIINVINKYFKKLLSGLGEKYYEAGMKHKVSPIMMAAISINETANGDPWQYINGVKKPAVIVTCNNVCGMNRREGFKYKGRYTQYDSISQSIEDMAYWIRHHYIDTLKKDTILEIAPIFAPSNDYQNGLWGMDNDSWYSVVSGLYESMNDEIK